MNTYRFIIIILLSYFSLFSSFQMTDRYDKQERFSSLHGDGYRISREVLSHRADHLKSGRDNHLSKDFLIFVSDSVHVLKAKLIFYNLGAARSQTRREYWWRVTGIITKCPISFKQDIFTVTHWAIDGIYIMQSIRRR